MNTNTESKRFFRRSIICAVAIFIFFIVLLVRLFYLQVIEHRFYATLSKRNVISIIPVQPNRGLIYDRNGVLLAKNVPVYSLMVIPGRVKNLKDTIAQLTDLLHLTPDEVKAFYHIEKQYYPYQSVPLKQQLTEEEADEFYVNQYRFPGVSVQTNMIRQYPLGETTGDVVGYVGRINAHELANVDPTNYTASDEIGKAGVEKEDEVLLHGIMGSEEAEIDANGKIVRVLKMTPPTPGDNLYLTIDSKLQAFAEQAFGKNAGALVAIQPGTGQVLAIVNKPSYDPNMFVKGMTNAQYHTLLMAPDHPLFNRALRGLYAPGSTVKPFIAFSALNLGVINTQDYIFDPGWFRIPNTKHIFHNWKHSGFGWVNVTKAIMVSCDTFFYELATVLGIDRLDQALTQFGFGSLTGINLPSERAGVVPSPEWKMKHIGKPWYTGDTVVAGIGQGYLLSTPVQLAAATTVMAERGLKLQPTVLLKLQQPNSIMTTMQPIEEQPIVAQNPKAWDTVIQGMQQVVNNSQGTAFSSYQGVDYTVAGKTGTAQLYGSKQDAKNVTTLNDHWFISFAPVNNPQIVIAIVVEHISGMTPVAVQIARKVMDYYMNELKQNPSLETAPLVNNNVLPIPTDLSTSNAKHVNPLAQIPQPQNPTDDTTGPALPAPGGSTATTLPAPTNAPSKPAPTGAVQSEPAPTDANNTDKKKSKKSKKSKKKSVDENQLEQQMDMNADMRMDLATPPSTTNAVPTDQ